MVRILQFLSISPLTKSIVCSGFHIFYGFAKDLLRSTLSVRDGRNMARTNLHNAGDRPAKARSFAAEPRWGRRKARRLPPAQDAALGLLGALAGTRPTVSWRLSPPRTS